MQTICGNVFFSCPVCLDDICVLVCLCVCSAFGCKTCFPLQRTLGRLRCDFSLLSPPPISLSIIECFLLGRWKGTGARVWRVTRAERGSFVHDCVGEERAEIMRLTQRARRPVQKELLAVFEKMMAQRPASGGARRAPEGPYAMEDARPQFDDSLIDGGDAVGYPVPRGEDGRDGGDRPWPRPLPAVPPPSDMEEDPPRRIVRVVNSLFPHKKPTVFFDYPSYVGQ